MEKAFKYFCVFMSVIIILSSFCMVFAVALGKNQESDFLGCKEIVDNIKNYEMNMTSVIYVKNDSDEWEEYQRIHGTENRIWVDIEKMPQQLIDAFVSIEDQRFYLHSGVDWKRTAGAVVNFLPFIDIYSSNQGGSTITQQLIKNITSDNDKSAMRKVREIARALLIEKMIDKTTILEAYLNTISLGNGICGVQVAANYYFNKNVDELTLAECASLAAITKNPSAYNPMTKPEGNKARRDDVLYKMYELGKITEEEYGAALVADVVIDKTQQQDFEIPINNYFVDALISDISEDLSVKYNCTVETATTMLYNGGYKIYATLDTDIQDIMESVYLKQKTYFSQKSSEDKSVNVQSAMTIIDYNGNIKGIVGGVGEKTVNRGLNRAIDSPRQPGSTMKPLGVYVQAIDNGSISYSSMIEDKPLEKYYEDGKKGPKEWYGYYAGNMTVAKALERSANTIPCWVLKDNVGVENSFNFLTQKLKLKHLNSIDKNLSSLALGGCQYGITTTESAAAYAIFGNGGKYYEPTTYTKVLDINGEIILEPSDGAQVIKESTAGVMNKLLQNVVYGSQGTGKGIASYSKMKAYAKTGTSSESKDLWMVAGTPYYVGSVWYGFDQPENVHNAGAAAKVWRDIMTQIHKDLEEREFELSDEVIEAKYCRITGKLAVPSCYSTDTGYYVPGVEIESCKGGHPAPEPEEETSSEETPSDASSSESSSTDSAPSSESGDSSDETASSEDVETSSDDTSTEPTESDDSSNESSSDDTINNDSSEESGSSSRIDITDIFN
ncbi:MAG: transglycosylase domain-containing protein [Clostridia bacterium]|nr:transglycosylase domain-containing protein [Clostridia bacterium]